MTKKKHKTKHTLSDAIGTESFGDLRGMIIAKDVNHENKKFIEDTIKNLNTDKTMSNRVINAGISTLKRLYNIAIITEIDEKTGRVKIVEWFKERRRTPREEDDNEDI